MQSIKIHVFYPIAKLVKLKFSIVDIPNMCILCRNHFYILCHVFFPLKFPIHRAFYYHFEVQTKHETILYQLRNTKTIAQLAN